MKKVLVRFFISFIFLPTAFLFLLTPKVSAEDCSIKLKSPGGGETFTEGDTATISWDSSDKIDKVSIMYKSDAHHGNWVAFSHSNTGSYSWNVNVGNTTNTQFYIEITGFWTGHCSAKDQSGWFTVYQKEESPPKSSPQPTASSAPQASPSPLTTSPTSGSTYIGPTPTPQPIIKKDQEIKPAPTSLSMVTFASWFYFEGSLTTDLAKIDDPKNVENFTLDTVQGWTVVYTETLNLTDPTKLAALQNIGNYWIVESWFIWIKIEWWEVFEKPVEITCKNEDLTSFEPTLAVAEVEEEGRITKEAEKKTVVKVTETKPGEVKATVDGPGKIEIKPKVELLGDKEVRTGKTSYLIKAKSSHKNLDYRLKINGKEEDVEPKDFDEESGQFTVKATGLIKGANFVQLLYKQKDDENYQLAGEKTIYYKTNYLKYLLLVGGIIILTTGLMATGIVLEKKFKLTLKATKLFEKLTKKVRK